MILSELAGVQLLHLPLCSPCVGI